MLTLYSWTTPNGYKPLLALEELGLPHRVVPIDIGKGAQRDPAYLQKNPNGKIPALLVEEEGQAPFRVFESGAILIYLAERTGELLPKEGAARYEALAWLMFQMGGVGPMMGQLGHFLHAKREDSYGVDRYRKEVERILGVLDERLAKSEYLAGAYSIADIATYPWVKSLDYFSMNTDGIPHVAAWLARIAARPAAQRAFAWKGEAREPG